MKTTFAAIALAAALAQPASAITFSKLTTIYIASGVFDDGSAEDTGIATSVHCTNVSGQVTTVRVLVLDANGEVVAADSTGLAHGATMSASTHGTLFGNLTLSTGPVVLGVFNIESLQSAVFCSAMIVDAATPQNGVARHMVRVNGHPGTVE